MQGIPGRRWRLALCGTVTLAGLVWGAVALGGCGGGGGGGGDTTPPPALTDEVIAAIEQDSAEITDLVEASETGSYDDVATQAESLDTVEWAQADEGTLTVKYKNAGLEAWVSPPDWVRPAVWPTASSAAARGPRVRSQELVGGQEAVLINSVAGDPGFDPEVVPLIDESEDLLVEMGYNVRRLAGSACNAESMKRLKGAAVVGFCGHGGAVGSGSGGGGWSVGTGAASDPMTFIQTGQAWNSEVARQYEDDWQARRVVCVDVPWGTTNRNRNMRRMLAVSNLFFSEYYRGSTSKLSSALFYNGGCQGLKNNMLAGAVAAAGASAYLGWTETQRIGPWAMVQLFRSMRSGMTLQAALGSMGPGLSSDDFYDDEEERQIHADLEYRPTDGGSVQLLLPGQGVDPFRVTLTWDAQNDIDLHVFARPSRHSYYANKAIDIGELDVDDVDGYGPEHFTARERIDGTYYVAANYYSDRDTSAATPTYVQVETASTVKSYGPYTLQTENANSGYPVRGSTNSWWRVCDIHVLSNGSVDVRSPDTSIPLGNYGYGGTYGVRHSAAGPRKDYEAVPVGIDPSLRPFMVPEGASR